jgi:hypothetical protein
MRRFKSVFFFGQAHVKRVVNHQPKISTFNVRPPTLRTPLQQDPRTLHMLKALLLVPLVSFTALAIHREFQGDHFRSWSQPGDPLVAMSRVLLGLVQRHGAACVDPGYLQCDGAKECCPAGDICCSVGATTEIVIGMRTQNLILSASTHSATFKRRLLCPRVSFMLCKKKLDI